MKSQASLALISVLLLVGCATTTEPVTQTKIVREGPPASLYPDCSEPTVTLKTNGDLARGFDDMREALRSCRQGVNELREWSDGR